MLNGTIKFFSSAKGFGFISPDDGSRDVYIHTSVLKGAGAGALKAGQRVSFLAEVKGKGPEATELKLLDAPDRPMVASKVVKIYCDPSNPEVANVLPAISEAGYEFQLHDYVSVPLKADQLKHLSAQVGSQGQSLVLRYVPLFLELQLDDRFIGEMEFWTAVYEHPALIDGPIVVIADRARICKSVNDVRIFLGLEQPVPSSKKKGIPPRMAAMLNGNAYPNPAAEPAQDEPAQPSASPVMVSGQNPGSSAAQNRKAPTRAAAKTKKIPAPKPAKPTSKSRKTKATSAKVRAPKSVKKRGSRKG